MIQWIPTGVMQVEWTSAAKSLKDLMDTAVAWKWTAAAALNPNYVLLNPEWVIRYTLDWQTPTATVWLEWVDLGNYYIESSLDKIIIINAIKVNIMVGFKTLD